jgi:Fe-S cluster assembly protein SufD
METVITNELFKSASKLQLAATDFSSSYLDAMKSALSIFKDKGIPNKKNEDWKYTNIAKNLSPRVLDSNEINDIALPIKPIDENFFIVLNNGKFNRLISKLPQGVELSGTNPETHFFDSFDALNFSTSIGATSFVIRKNTHLKKPLTLLHIVDESAVNKINNPRVNFVIEDNAKIAIVEVFTSTQNLLFQYTTNAVTQFKIEKNSSVEHVKIQSEAKKAVHIGLTKAEVARDANFNSYTFDLGILTSRHNINVNLNESGANSQVHGLFTLNKDEHSDIFSNIFHKVAHTNSEQLVKGILSGESHGVFTGKIVVEKDAQQISSTQLNKNLILSKKALIDTRPQLLVHADDVKCSHGATIGQLSPEEEFYLESRGIPKHRAKEMLCHGFGSEIIYKIENEEIKKFTESLITFNYE